RLAARSGRGGQAGARRAGARERPGRREHAFGRRYEQRRPGGRRERGRAVGEGSRSGAAAAVVHAPRGRADRPRRVRGGAPDRAIDGLDDLDGLAGEGEQARADIAELLPVDRFEALLELIGDEAEIVIAAEEEVAPALADNWSDVCAAFADEDAHHLYVPPLLV